MEITQTASRTKLGCYCDLEHRGPGMEDHRNLVAIAIWNTEAQEGKTTACKRRSTLQVSLRLAVWDDPWCFCSKVWLAAVLPMLVLRCRNFRFIPGHLKRMVLQGSHKQAAGECRTLSRSAVVVALRFYPHWLS